MDNTKKKIVHSGVPGMKWGVRNNRTSGGKNKGKSSKQIKASMLKAKAKTRKALNLFGSKRLSYTEREQKRRDTTKQLVKTAIRIAGALAVMDIVSGIGSTSNDK